MQGKFSFCKLLRFIVEAERRKAEQKDKLFALYKQYIEQGYSIDDVSFMSKMSTAIDKACDEMDLRDAQEAREEARLAKLELETERAKMRQEFEIVMRNVKGLIEAAMDIKVETLSFLLFLKNTYLYFSFIFIQRALRAV